MDYTTWPESQQNQTPLSSYPPSVPSSYPQPSSFTTQYPSYPQNPNPSSSIPQSSLVTHGGTLLEPGLNPPGVDSYAPLNSNPNIITHLGHEGLPNFLYGHTHSHVVDSSSLVASSGYYLDPNTQNWAAREAVRQYGANPVSHGAGISVPSDGSEQLAFANPNSTLWTNTTTKPHGNGIWKKHLKKAKTKIVQSAYCEVCKIDCTSKDVLDQHKLGKKHKKNLEKLRESLKPTQVHPSGSSNPVIGPQVHNDKSKSDSGQKSKRKTVETPEDLEKKKKKVLEGGAAAEAVRICAICNVVCNSETVYNYHLSGQKHAAMVKKASDHTRSNTS
ncbi:uncharacterized protein LOC133309223 [Gastrolobium bilobum]|uniref:uncharacterized protein LOC133309223 n=1 Tax=Gastrolobium bilobum TaxID=150636 RepID=UPI002AB09517|nr:uncharacterized protein LOC133309223 [Gastrolobium bilobum]